MILNTATFKNVEARLQSLLEFHLFKDSPDYQLKNRVIHHLVDAMCSNIESNGSIFIAPIKYSVFLHPLQEMELSIHTDFINDLAKALQKTGDEFGFHLSSPPIVLICPSTFIRPSEILVSTSENDKQIPETRDISSIIQSHEKFTDTIPKAALIQDGKKILPLDKPVIAIGRLLSNDITIDDPNISRSHAQLRIQNNRYILIDLESKCGTFVNGKRVINHVMESGDIISFAGQVFIYEQDTTPDEILANPQTQGSTVPSFPLSDFYNIESDENQ